MVAGKTSDLIKNDPKKGNLIYKDGTIAADKYYLGKPLEKSVKGWTRKELYPLKGRKTSVSDEEMNKIIQPVISSINNNNPVVFYSSLSWLVLMTNTQYQIYLFL